MVYSPIVPNNARGFLSVVLLSGKPVDDEHPIYTRDGWKIPTEKAPIKPIGILRRKVDFWKIHRPNARLRSTSTPGYPYNCVGMIFASRRKWIEIDYISEILRRDGYKQILKQNAVVGDVVLYRDHHNEYSHIAMIIQIEAVGNSGTMNIRVLSKWGEDPEYEHFEDDVPPLIGKPVEYWTERQT